MIYDKLERIGLYRGMDRSLDAAIDFLLSHDLHALPLGRTEILGDRVFLNKMEANASPAEGRPFEVHRRYADIQIDVSGSERVDTGELSDFHCPDFSEEKDIGFGDCAVCASCVLRPGDFTVCLAGEPHKPGICTGADTALVKCVVKVAMEDRL
ncbi:MAG: YhcH/YjgK/YiaL family protein [Eubacteriales bacterium]|nr:YhcH/YjgK/YiaL family protein [Eubacteriales bacterium]